MAKRWELKEIADSKSFGGKRVSGSGSKWWKPGDIVGDIWLTECKQTDKKSYSLNIDKWDKISKEALFKFKHPMMSIKIRDTELVVLAKEEFEKIILAR